MLSSPIKKLIPFDKNHEYQINQPKAFISGTSHVHTEEDITDQVGPCSRQSVNTLTIHQQTKDASDQTS